MALDTSPLVVSAFCDDFNSLPLNFTGEVELNGTEKIFSAFSDAGNGSPNEVLADTLEIQNDIENNKKIDNELVWNEKNEQLVKEDTDNLLKLEVLPAPALSIQTSTETGEYLGLRENERVSLQSEPLSPLTKTVLKVLNDEQNESMSVAHDEKSFVINQTDQVKISNVVNTPTTRGSEFLNRSIHIFIGTWNLHAKPWPDSLDAFITPPGRSNNPDLFVIGTEECLFSIEASSVVTPSKSSWEDAVLNHLNKRRKFSVDLSAKYIKISSIGLGATHLMIFSKKELAPLITQIEANYVVTGFGNFILNKGGVGIGFQIGPASFLFINAHFQAEQEQADGRNQDFHRINQKMQLRQGSEKNVTDRFDYVFWSGDLNYRVNTTRKMADSLLKKEMLEVMLANDQLNVERNARRCFDGFSEGAITFSPTYKFDVGSDHYDSSSKARIPSWTDRILYKSIPEIKLLEYKSIPTIRTSDHKPVVAIFQLRIASPEERDAGDIPTLKDTVIDLHSAFRKSCAIL